MDAFKATKIVLQRIQSLDPENAAKIMGLLLIQDHGEKEMIRLAFGPEALLHSVIVKARKELALHSTSHSTPSSPSSPSPFSNPIPFSRQNSSSSSSRFMGGVSLPSPLSITNKSSSFRAQEDLLSPSVAVGSSSSSMNSSPSRFYSSGAEVDLIDEFQLQDQLSFLNDGDPLHFPTNYGGGGGGGSTNSLYHRRSFSVSDICFGSDDPNAGLGWKPCLYFARGFCKNGSSCRFLHNGLGDDNMVGSPSKFEMMGHCQELLRSKSAMQQQQRLAAASQLMANSSFPYSPEAAEKCMNFFLQQQQLQAESPRGDFRINGGPGMANPASRQIYLTFPADSTFKEEDVSNYFSMYGPVQDVRIPYQQQRMFGFVTFVYPETVKIILAKGNPHFVCDSRVLVKPYKEKGKVPEKLRKQQLGERGEFAGCGSPTGLESGDAFDIPLGTRMLYDGPEMLRGRNLEHQADLQQPIELQNRRLMGLRLLDVKRAHHHRTLSSGATVSSPLSSIALARDAEKSQEHGLDPLDANPETVTKQAGNVGENGDVKGNLGKQESDSSESEEHNLPDSPFASPKVEVAGGEYVTGSGKVGPVPAPSFAKNDEISSSLLPASMKSCYNFLPSLAPGHETVGM